MGKESTLPLTQAFSSNAHNFSLLQMSVLFCCVYVLKGLMLGSEFGLPSSDRAGREYLKTALSLNLGAEQAEQLGFLLRQQCLITTTGVSAFEGNVTHCVKLLSPGLKHYVSTTSRQL